MIICWLTLFIRNITIASIVWRLMVAAASLVVMSSAASSSQTNQRSPQWRASFYYLHHLPSSDAHDHDGDDAELSTGPQPSFHELHTALRSYREMADGIVRQLSIAYEVASRTEQLLFPNHDPRISCKDETANSPSFLSCKVEQKINKSARLLEQNIVVLEELLKPFPVTVGLSPHHHASYYLDSPSSSRDSANPTASSLSNSKFTFPPSNDEFDQHATESDLPSMQSLARYIPPYKPSQSKNDIDGEEEPYDTASHIITHMARDWTAVGESIREDTHNWIVHQLWTYHDVQVKGLSHRQLNLTCSRQSPLSPVLVPGAGMARLAFDMAFARNKNDGTKVQYPFAVEAIDNSLVMATAAYHLIHRHSINGQDGALNIYPIVSDPCINEVDTERRWDSALFPEENVSDQLRRLDTQQSSDQPILSYVIGDFVSVYSSRSKHGMYGSIATCFFIDTATNIYEYILTIRNLLRTGGVWINLGPVQWHRNAQLQPSTNELKDMIIMAGFEIVHWEISDQLLAYRHPDDIRVGTRAEAYRPLKFVVVLQPDHRAEVKAETGDNLLSSLENVRQVTGRRSMVHNSIIDNVQHKED